ncbi:hypothetical protein GHA01_10180 [Novacetimonas hansenii]|uniref:Uncharacterized protein n=1 Tax=Novacetimonas hansenii TaxID=436 RepID=A0ABQ0SD88_NOVHA|nr:hypothetical protein BGC30_12210 [Novacetimonas hansenii]GAN84134.1 hypothetical protein Gaha_0132_013 [Novacetimonas hansenii JCM 7643]GBQ52544.1 hypothetical protein AA0243_0060 [Novacetimonas hansenii NRIC 0243]GEC63169.1 hypothetical protein GHA01_10180 [Novacetimonas hansenii]
MICFQTISYVAFLRNRPSLSGKGKGKGKGKGWEVSRCRIGQKGDIPQGAMGKPRHRTKGM